MPSDEEDRARGRAGSGPQEGNTVGVKMRAPAGGKERGLDGTGRTQSRGC